VHRIVIPFGPGEPSFEDVTLLKRVVMASRATKATGKRLVNLDARDKHGKTPLD
jgi:hypothetical protein